MDLGHDKHISDKGSCFDDQSGICCAPVAGYGDNLNIMDSIHLMQQYVERQNKIWLALEMDKGRGVDLAEVEDPRVDLCLFCIQPHRLRPVDLR